MIYDLNYVETQVHGASGESEDRRATNLCLLAIAERLELLAEAQKPRWVEFTFGNNHKFSVDANEVNGVCEAITEGVPIGVEITRQGVIDRTSESYAEVMAKLRG